MRKLHLTATWGTGRRSAPFAGLPLGLLLALAGCDDDSAQHPDDGRDSGCPGATLPVESNPFDGQVAWFVVDSLRVGDPHIGSALPGEGFNLDCTATPAGDPWLPEDGLGGIDNAFGGLVQALVRGGFEVDVDGDMQRAIEDGRVLLAFRLADVDDWVDDVGLVYMSVYSAIDADADPTNNFTGSARLLVDDRSLVDPTDLLSARTWFLNGILRDSAEADARLDVGDFTASGADVVLDIAAGETVVPLTIRDAHVVWDFETAPTGEPPTHGRLANGLLGGSVPLLEAVRFILAAYPTPGGYPIDERTMQLLAAGQADMDLRAAGFTDAPCTEATASADCTPGQTCEPDPFRADTTFCFEQDDNADAISVGFVFTAVSVDITGIAHTTPPP
jgi:hypothetical protein